MLPIVIFLHHQIGTMLATRMLCSMSNDGAPRGLDALCIGGGQCIALMIQTV
jgi:hypothetical protein